MKNKIAITLLNELSTIVIGGAILLNTWWCLFISQYSPGLRFLWWMACLVIAMFIIGAMHLGEQDAKKNK